MRAILVDTNSPTRTLVWGEAADPHMGPDEVRVAIYAAALNRADLLQRAGGYAPPPGESEILGLEMAGLIIELGANVTGWKVGDRVCALLPGGGYAQQAVVPASMLMAVPRNWTFAQAAALPEVYLTAYLNLFMEAGLQPGETVLAHGGASGVGTAAIQLCQTSGNPVIVTAGSREKCAACLKLGATHAVNYREGEWGPSVRALMPDGVDVVLDMVGADYLAANLSLLRLKGRLVFISTLSGAQAQIDLRQVMSKRLRLIGSLLRSRTLAEKVEIKERFVQQFWSRVEDGTLMPVIDRIFPVEQANEAHERMAKNQNIGKIVMEVRL